MPSCMHIDSALLSHTRSLRTPAGLMLGLGLGHASLPGDGGPAVASREEEAPAEEEEAEGPEEGSARGFSLSRSSLETMRRSTRA